MNQKLKSDNILKQIALQEPAIAGLLEDLGYGPWRAAQKKAETKARKK